MYQIIDGKAISTELKEELKEKVWNIKIEKDFKEAIETTKKLKKETTKKKVGK